MSPTQPRPIITSYLPDWLIESKFFPEIFQTAIEERKLFSLSMELQTYKLGNSPKPASYRGEKAGRQRESEAEMNLKTS